MTKNKATMTIDNSHHEFPLLSPTLGKMQIDVSTLGKTCGVFALDPGFLSTSSCESKITFIDGEKGTLLYRGYPIEQLADQSSYLETAYLLFNGELPNQGQLDQFTHAIKQASQIPPLFKNIFKGFSQQAHPMAVLCSAVSALADNNHQDLDISDSQQRQQIAIRLLAMMPVLVAMTYRHHIGQDFVEPNLDLSYSENFLYMMFSNKVEAWTSNSTLSQAIDKIFILHADHEQNASTSTVRLAGSTGTDPYAAIAAGVAALRGPAHGGANEAALKMLKQIGNIKNISQYISRAKDKDDPFRLMGFGHRVYKNYDPRATVMRQTCHQVLKQMNDENDPILQVAMSLEKIALEDQYFVDRKLYPNVDFYSGITQSALGIPSDMFTAIFALARSIGWIAHWHEMLSGPYKIGRPRQLYTGETKRDIITIQQR